MALQPARANFLEAMSVGDIEKHLKSLPSQSIVFVDIDDTVMTPESKAFRIPPYNKMMDNIKKNKAHYSNHDEILSNWRLQRKTRLLDDQWPSFINMLKKHFQVFGLTKMDVGALGNIESIEEWRFNEVASLGVLFSDKDFPSHLGQGAFYKGIFLTGIHSKSEIVSYYKDYLQAETFVLVDDRHEHLQDMQRFCQKQGKEFVGILYKGLESLQDRPNPVVATFQEHYLITNAQWLEDLEAEAKMKKLGIYP